MLTLQSSQAETMPLDHAAKAMKTRHPWFNYQQLLQISIFDQISIIDGPKRCEK
jgi:hypothetical protein